MIDEQEYENMKEIIEFQHIDNCKMKKEFDDTLYLIQNKIKDLETRLNALETHL